MLTQVTARERIMAYGAPGVGKSFMWLDILEAYYQSGDRDTHFYIIDSDFGVTKLLEEGYQHLEDAGMMTVYNPYDFPGMIHASREIRSAAKKGDWIVLDLADQAWDEAQLFYTGEVYGKEPLDYFIQMRKEVVAKKGKDKRAYGGMEGTDWQFVNKIYHEFESALVLKSLANVFVVCGEKKLDPDRGASVADMREYRSVGRMAPKGQKGLAHRMDTIFYMTKRVDGQRVVTMTKDRGREGTKWLDRSHTLKIDAPPKGFTKRYLVNVAGWENKKKGKEKSKSSPKRRLSTPKRKK